MQQKILKGSKTEANLLAAFAGESQARNKYTFFGAKAKEDGFQQIGDLFLETANNEKMYPTFAKEAREEGFDRIATLFELVAKIEQEHMQRFQHLKGNVDGNTVFQKPQSVTWICLNCGHIYEGTTPPPKCPVCEKPQAWFQVKAENY